MSSQSHASKVDTDSGRNGPSVRYYHVAGGSLLGTVALMLLGAYTSAIGAGLSCPDWPTCYGTWVPFLHSDVVASSPYSSWQIFAEWAHRGLAMVVGVSILVTAGLAWRSHRQRPLVVWPAIVALALVPIQVVLGGLTVTERLEPVVVTGHLGTATLIALALTATTTAAWIHRNTAKNDGWRS